VRALAEELRINRNTAARAYTELEAEGVIETRQGAGCFLKANGASPLRKTVRSERLAAELDAVIVQAHHLQISDAELKTLLEERLAALRDRLEANQESRA
jgi:GntR family transcriptional regulator